MRVCSRMRKKRILAVTQSPTFGGGGSECLIGLINSIDERFDIHLMIPRSKVLKEGLLKKIGKRRIIEYNFNEYRGAFQYGSAVLRFMYFLLINKIDLFYFQDFGISWKPAELLAAKILGIPIISHLHGDLPKEVRNSFLKFSNLVIGNSKFALSPFKDTKLPLKVVYNSINVEKFDQGKSKLIPKEKGIKIAFVGRIRMKKGVMVYINTAKEILKKRKNVHFYVVGDDLGALDGCLDKAKEFVNKNKLSKHFTFTGLIYDAPQFMKYVDIVVVPSIFQEPFGLVNIEAMAARKAVVASDVGGIPEIIEDGVNGLLIPSNDSAELASAVERLIKDKKLRKKLGENGRKTVEEKFSTKKQIKEFERVFYKFTR